MGNCQCLPVNQCKKLHQLHIQKTETLKLIKDEQPDNVSKTSLVSFSRMTLSNLSEFRIESGKQNRLKESQVDMNLSYSRCGTSMIASLVQDIQNSSDISVEVIEKLTIKQFYQLKKMIQKAYETTKILHLGQRYFECPKTDLDKINEIQFKKLHLITQQNQDVEVCYLKGQISNRNGIKRVQGVGQLFFSSGAYYNGHFANNYFSKVGIYIHPDKDYYYGDWKFSKANGFGQFGHYEGVLCRGQWAEDQQHGMGEEYWPDGAIFKGMFHRGSKKKGKFEWPNRSSYDGDFVDNKFQGKGIFIWQDNKMYRGQWKNNMMHGLGIFQWPNGQIFKGYYSQDKKHGKGQLKMFDGTTIRGRWINGKLEGMSEVSKDGAVAFVRWQNGVQLQ